MDIFSFLTCSFFLHFVAFGLSSLSFLFRLAAFFSMLLPLVKGKRVQAFMDFFGSSTSSFFFHFIAFGLRFSGLGFDGYCLFFDLLLCSAFYCLWFIKGRWFQAFMDFFCFSTCTFLLHFITFGLRTSGVGFHEFCFVFRFAPFFGILLPLD